MDSALRALVIADLCCECVRNAAYYRSGWSSGKLLLPDVDFWVNLNGNFLDIAVLAWCYLFGDPKAEFRWQRVIRRPQFLETLNEQIDCDQAEFEEYISRMRLYRDKRIAHRDRYVSGDRRIDFPDLEIAINSATFLFAAILQDRSDLGNQIPIKDLKLFYEERFTHGREEYDARQSVDA